MIMSKSNKKWLTIGIIGVLLVVGLFFGIMSYQRRPVVLDAEFYGESEAMDIDGAGYEKAIAEKKSFVVLVDNENCVTARNMRKMMGGFPEELQFRYYRIMWPEALRVSLHDYVKYFPSVAVVRNGEMVAWLRADADEDAAYYNDAEALEGWLRRWIVF